MKFKLQITEKFLWDLYNLVEKTDGILPDLFTPTFTIREAIYPELKRLKKGYNKQRNKWLFRSFIAYLKRRGYIKIKELENKNAVILTPKGICKLRDITVKIKIGKKRRDGKWQMVVFDIPEKKRFLRDELRRKLHELGYQKFQRSIWICPNDVLEETQDLVKSLSLEHYVRLLLVEEMEIS